MGHLQTDEPILFRLFLRSGDDRGSKLAARLLMSLELQYINVSQHCVTNSDNHWSSSNLLMDILAIHTVLIESSSWPAIVSRQYYLYTLSCCLQSNSSAYQLTPVASAIPSTITPIHGASHIRALRSQQESNDTRHFFCGSVPLDSCGVIHSFVGVPLLCFK